MADIRKIREYIKSAVIVLLVIAALLLLYLTGYYSVAVEKVGMIIGASDKQESDILSGYESEGFGPAKPLMVSVSTEYGNRYSSVYSEQVQEDYSRFSAFLAEALGTAGEAEKRNEAEWIRAVENESVYIRYFSPVSISYLANSVGTEYAGENHSFLADEFCLSFENDRVCLYYRNREEIYHCQSAVSQNVLHEIIAEFSSDGSHFSYASARTRGIEKSIIIEKELSEVPEIKGSGVGISRISEQLMLKLEINELTANSYVEANGVNVYVDEKCVLRISASGSVDCEFSGDSFAAEDESIDSLIDLCWPISAATLGTNCGSAELYMSGVSVDEEGNSTVCFDYCVGGIPVLGSRGHAAKFVFSGSALQKLEMNFRSYSHTGITCDVLPMFQAAAIASSKRCETLSLVYYDLTDNTECIWVNE